MDMLAVHRVRRRQALAQGLRQVARTEPVFESPESSRVVMTGEWLQRVRALATLAADELDRVLDG
jgi:hypothetical protein